MPKDPAAAPGKAPSPSAPSLAEGRTLIGLKDGWRKTVVEADGGLRLPRGRVSFGLNDKPLGAEGPPVQKLYRGYLPAVVTQDVHGDLAAGLLAFSARTPWGPADFVRVRLRADRGAERTLRFTVAYHGEGAPQGANVVVSTDASGRGWLVAVAQGPASAWKSTSVRDTVILEHALPVSPQAPAEFWVVFPWEAFPSDLKGIEGLDGDEALDAMGEEWESLLSKGTNLLLPDEAVVQAAKAALAQLLLLRERDPKGWYPAAGPGRSQVFALKEAAFMVEALDHFAYVDEVRECLDYLLAVQRPDGRFESSSGKWEGTGQAAWALTGHFWLTRDLAWLRRITPALQKAALWVAEARRSARGGAHDTGGLLPGGGVSATSGAGEFRLPQAFGPNCWGMLACRLAQETSAYLGQDAAWLEAEVDDYREALTSAFGTLVAGPGTPGPDAIRGALRAVYPCEAVDPRDPRLGRLVGEFAAGLTEGLPAELGSFSLSAAADLGQVYIQREEYDHAAAIMQAMLDHASATLSWGDVVQASGTRATMAAPRPAEGGGDMPAGCVAAAFLLLLRNLLVTETGSTLHLFPGTPRAWTGSGRRIDVKRLPTSFGLLEASLKTEGGDTYVGIVLTQGREPEQLVVHLRFAEPRTIKTIGLHGICDDERLEGDRLIIEKPKGVLFVSLSHERAP